jgi:outer membrane protein OmpA-like peptidoglycan-associated protein
MAYASPSQVRAPYASTHPGVGAAAAARVDPGLELRAAPRDAFREKAERKAKQKAEKEARLKGVAAAAVAPKAAARIPAVAARPKLVPKPATVASPLPVERPKPKLTVHVNPRPEPKAAAAPLILAAATIAPPPPVAAKPPAEPPKKPPAPKGGGRGGGGAPPPDVENEKVVDRDLLMGGLISSALLLFLGWNMFGGKGPAPAAPVSPEPLLKVAAAPAPDPFPSLAPLELRPQEPLPPAAPSVEPTQQAAAPAAPEVKTAQAPPAKPVPAISACERVKMVQAYFCTASSTLTPDMRSVLEKQLTDWKACLGGDALVVKGYADARGGEQLNASLSTRRANTLRDFLKAHDVKVSEAKGEGVLPGQAPEDCQNQRRVDVSIGETTPSAACAPPKDAPLPGCG